MVTQGCGLVDSFVGRWVLGLDDLKGCFQPLWICAVPSICQHPGVPVSSTSCAAVEECAVNMEVTTLKWTATPQR